MTTLTHLQPDLIAVYTTRGELPQAIREATYQTALKLVNRIDAGLTSGRRHFRNRAGVLLEKLDQVVVAILDNDLMGFETDAA